MPGTLLVDFVPSHFLASDGFTVRQHESAFLPATQTLLDRKPARKQYPNSGYAFSFQPRFMRKGGQQLHKDWNFQLRLGGARQMTRSLRAAPTAGFEARMDYRIQPLQTLSLRAGFGMTKTSAGGSSGWGRISAVLNLRF